LRAALETRHFHDQPLPKIQLGGIRVVRLPRKALSQGQVLRIAVDGKQIPCGHFDDLVPIHGDAPTKVHQSVCVTVK